MREQPVARARIKDACELAKKRLSAADATRVALFDLPMGAQRIHVEHCFTYDLNGILEVDMTIEATGKTETLVIESGANRLTPKQLEEARKAMARLK